MTSKASDIRCDVLHLNTERFMRGGEVQTLGLMRRLVAGGLRCTLLAKDDGVLLQRAGAEGLSTVGLPLRGEFDLLSARKIRRVVRESGATILHCHTAHALGLGLWATLGMTCRPALVASRRVSFPLKHSA